MISSPVPYLITNGTVITTDPSITTNGVTDYGKIYRGQTDDGAFSLWAFGSTSAFDTALRIDDTFFADPSHLPIAVFKFESLSLTGDPTIDTSNGVTKLALIGVDGITSGPPGGTLTFTGLDLLLLATVNGSINLTSDVSFQDLHELVMYARGAGSDLTINSPISNIGILGLVAEDSLHLTNPGTMSVGKLDVITGSDLMLQIGGSLLLNGRVRLDAIVLPGASVASGANLTLNVTGDYTNNSATESSRLAITNRDHIGTGGNIGVNIGGDLTAMNDFNLVVQNTNGQIDNGGNITLQGGGSINVAGALDATLDNTGGLIGNDTSITITSSGAVTAQGDATFQILNSDNGSGGRPGQIGGNASIAVTTGEDFTANSILAFVNNHNGGAITSGANISFNIGGALNTQGDATFVVSNLNEGPGGGTIGSLASVDINAASISVGGFFQTFTGANAGGRIQGDAINTVNVSGDLTAQQGILVDIQDTGFIQINPTVFIAGGHIGGDATVTLDAQNITTSSTATGVPGINTMALEASIYSDGSGTIGGNAIVNVMASQNISAPGTVFFGVANDNYQDFGGGTIGGDAQVNVTAGSLSTGAFFDDIYNNGGGSIGRDAIISLNLSNSFTATGNAEFAIFNPGGIVGRNASIGVTVGDISAPSLTAEIDNSSAGQIGGNALINFGVSRDFNIVGDANFQILNSNGTIGSDATLLFHSDSASIGGNLSAIISDVGGTIDGNALLNFSVTHDISVQRDAVWQILTKDGPLEGPTGGTIHGNATLLVSAANLTVPAGSLEVDILNQNSGVSGPGGTIDSSANITFNLSGNLTTQTDASFAIRNNYTASGPGGIGGIGGTIGQDAVVNINANSLSIGGTLDTSIHNGRNAGDNGGTIGGNATINLAVGGGITALDDSQFIGNGGGTIGSNAAIIVTAASLATTDTAPGALSASINNSGGGITGSANVNFNLSGDLTTQGDATFAIDNSFDGGATSGTIGSDAAISISANNISTSGSLSAVINNSTHPVNGFIGGTIGGAATIDVGAGNINANSLVAQIDNTGGSIGASTEAGAAINMNVAGTASVTTDATVAIYGSDGAGSAAININGGSYNVGGTFLTYIDGNGTITFNNASAHADVLKAGVFGANGALNIGGGTLSADSTLKLYAPGSNGQLNFVSNVTLGGNSAKILAANSVTIFNNVVVTIGGPNPADVYTNNPNYTGFGGNKSTTGTFAGAGANDPQPLSKAPPFGTVSRATVRTGGNITTDGSGTRGKKIDSVIHVSSSDELLSLLDRAAPGPGGKITIPRSKGTSNSRNSNRTDVADRLKAGSRVNADRRAMDMRTVSSSVIRRSPQ